MTDHQVALDLTRDQSALRDALAALDYFDDPAERAELAEKIQSIRRRLPDRGANVDRELDEAAVTFTRGGNRPEDPPGAIRIRRVVPDTDHGDEPYPRGPRNGAVAAALSAVAVALVGLT